MEELNVMQNMSLTPAKVKGFKVAELKAELTARGLDATGEGATSLFILCFP